MKSLDLTFAKAVGGWRGSWGGHFVHSPQERLGWRQLKSLERQEQPAWSGALVVTVEYLVLN